MTLWRARLHNEHSGMPKTDMSGANTSVSLLWCPNSTAADNYVLSSRRRVSQLKQVQDFGASPRAPPASSAAPQSARSSSAAAAAPLVPTPRSGVGQLAPPAPRGFLDQESARLQASAHARQLGQTFLRNGNLSMAKVYLARAEQILEVPKYDPKELTATLDEFRKRQRDPFA